MLLRRRLKAGMGSQDDDPPPDQIPLLKEDGDQLEVSYRSTNKLGLFSVIGFFIVFTQIFCEVTKQMSNYGLQYYSGGRYPFPQTVIVMAVEIIKLVATTIRSKFNPPSFSFASLKRSARFMLPSLLYAVNNNIYYYGLTLVPPPIWIILGSFRTVVTATVYKFVLKRQLSRLQFLGAFLIVISIAMAKAPDILAILDGHEDAVNRVSNSTSAPTPNPNVGVNVIPPVALVLAAIAACNSVGAAIYTEHLFKSGSATGESFLDQQFWLYLYGLGVSTIVHLTSKPHYMIGSFIDDVHSLDVKMAALTVVALVFASLGGIVVASILKLLDNVVKEYSGSVANILTAVICSIVYPDRFKFTAYIIFSMTSLLSGIYLYETQKIMEKPKLEQKIVK